MVRKLIDAGNAASPSSEPAVNVMSLIFPSGQHALQDRLRQQALRELLMEDLGDLMPGMARIESGRLDVRALRGPGGMARGLRFRHERKKYEAHFGTTPKWTEYVPMDTASRWLAAAVACNSALPDRVVDLYVSPQAGPDRRDEFAS